MTGKLNAVVLQRCLGPVQRVLVYSAAVSTLTKSMIDGILTDEMCNVFVTVTDEEMLSLKQHFRE